MGLIGGLLTLPLAPVRGVVSIAEHLRRATEQEFGEEATRRQLTELQLARDAGELTDAEYATAEAELIERLLSISASQEGDGHG